ncbi:MAG: N-6 DNA methylase [Bacteroidia bacterium]|nr:N-6 DNA methylase [Bacteroidia bacterium]
MQTKNEAQQQAEEKNSLFRSNIDRGIKAKIISLTDDESKIIYHCCRDYTTTFKNPEEKVRASYFVELVLDYQYPKQRIDIEVKVERRIPDDRADIVVYEDDELKTSFLVVENKKDGITDAEFKQAIEQAFGNANSKRAKYAIVVAGNTKTAFNIAGFKPSERFKNVIADIPVKYGNAPKYKFTKGDTSKDLKIVSREELIKALEKCHDTVWQGGKLAPTTAFDEVSKLLFCKLKDEKQKKKNDHYDFQIGTNETAEEVYARISAIYQKAKKEDEDVFKEDIRLDPKVVYTVVEHLQELAINKIDLDTKGVAFERFMQDFFKGKMGQFFTPRNVVDFCISILQPEHNQRVLDPACGSGGFLLNAMDFVRKYAEENHDTLEAFSLWHNFAKTNLYGIEINDQIARVCKMNMIIHDDGHTNVISTDGLEEFNHIKNINKKFTENSFDIILTNPPFGATIKNTEKNYLQKYDLGKGKKNQKTEILFIERCIDFLKPETGIIGVVLPDSITINSSLQYVRDYILERTQIIGIVSLPDIAFVHYGANVKSSLLFLRRLGDKEKIKDYSVFMAIADKIGYTATGKEEYNELPDIAEHFLRFENEQNKLKIASDYQDKIFVVQQSELKGKRIDPKGYTKYFKELKSTIEKSKETKVELKDCIIKSASGEWGLDPSTEEIPDGYELCYVLRNTNFDNNFNLNLSDVALRYIDSKKVKQLKLKKNEILIEKSGGSPVQPVGRVALIDNLPTDKPVLFSNFLQKIIVDEKKIDPTYLYSYLKTLYHRNYMEYIQNQTTGIKNLLVEDFMSIRVIKPDTKTQQKIGQTYYNEILEVKQQIEEAYKRLQASRQTTDEQLLS